MKFSHPTRGLRRGALATLLLLAFTVLVSLLITRWRIQSLRHTGQQELERLERLECVLSLAELTVIATVFLGLLLPLERQTRRNVDELQTLNRRLAARNRRLHRSRRDRARLASIVESSGDAILGMDAEGHIEGVNPAASTVFGVDLEALKGMRLVELVIEEDRRSLEHALSEVCHGGTVQRLLRGAHRPGCHLALTLSPIRTDDAIDGVSAIVRDVTAAVKDAQRLRDLNERYQLATEGARDILWDWNLPSGQFHLARRWREAVGASRHGIVDIEDWWGRVHPEDRPALEAAFESLCVGTDTHLEIEHRIRHHKGHYRWFLCRGAVHRSEQGEVRRLAGSLTDVTQRRRQSEALMRRALFDDLTGLANRGHLLSKLNDRAASDRRADERFAVLFLDLDGFKEVNDTWGHAAGDSLLEQVARRLESCVRENDVLARMGGDEFAVLLDRVESEDEAVTVAERIRDALARPFETDGHEVRIGTSIGVACVTRSRGSGEDILRDADAAMYQAKRGGKGCVVLRCESVGRRAPEPRRRRRSPLAPRTRSAIRVTESPSTPALARPSGPALESWWRERLEQALHEASRSAWTPEQFERLLLLSRCFAGLDPSRPEDAARLEDGSLQIPRPRIVLVSSKPESLPPRGG